MTFLDNEDNVEKGENAGTLLVHFCPTMCTLIVYSIDTHFEASTTDIF